MKKLLTISFAVALGLNLSAQTVASGHGWNYVIDERGRVQVWGKSTGYLMDGLRDDTNVPILRATAWGERRFKDESFEAIFPISVGLYALNSEGILRFRPFEGKWSSKGDYFDDEGNWKPMGEDDWDNLYWTSKKESLQPSYFSHTNFEGVKIKTIACWQEGFYYVTERGHFGVVESVYGDGRFEVRKDICGGWFSGSDLKALKVFPDDRTYGIFGVLDERGILKIYNPRANRASNSKRSCEEFWESNCSIAPILEVSDISDFFMIGKKRGQAISPSLAARKKDGSWEFYPNLYRSCSEYSFPKLTKGNYLDVPTGNRPNPLKPNEMLIPDILNSLGAVSCFMTSRGNFLILDKESKVHRIWGRGTWKFDMTNHELIDRWWSLSQHRTITLEGSGMKNRIVEFGPLFSDPYWSNDASYWTIASRVPDFYVVLDNGEVLLGVPKGKAVNESGYFDNPEWADPETNWIKGWTEPPATRSIVGNASNALTWGDEIPLDFENEGGVWCIDVSVNGLEEEFIFDTGASLTCLSRRAVQRLKSGGVIPYNIRPVDTVTMVDASGNESTLNTYIIEKMSIGRIEVRNIEVLFLENYDTVSLLGQSFLSKTSSYTFDSTKGTLRLKR